MTRSAAVLSRWGLALLVPLAGLGCGDASAPPAPGRDAAADDASGSEAGLEPPAPPGRPDGGPRLPPADLDLVLPFRGPTQTVSLEVSAQPGLLDVHFSVDTTGSFGEEIDAMQRDLDRRIIPALEARVEDIAFGISRFEDFPVPPFGQPGDAPFELLTAITDRSSRVASAVAGLDQPLGSGGDQPESGAEALYQVATGEGFGRAGAPAFIPAFSGRAAPGGGTVGGVGFREDALRVAVHITDAPPHIPSDYTPSIDGVRGMDEAARALRAIDVRVVGIASGDPARPHLEQLALATGAAVAPVDGTCATGIAGALRAPVGDRCPLVFDVRPDGTGLSEAIVDAIAELVRSVRFDEVYGAAEDDPFGFVRTVAAVRAVPAPDEPEPERQDRRPAGDGIDDTFTMVQSGTELEFEARLRNVRLRPQPDYDQIFRVRIQLRGDGRPLSERVVRVIVPRGRLPRDAGTAAPLDGGRASDAGPTDARAPDADADAATRDGQTDAEPTMPDDGSTDGPRDAG